MKKVLIFVMALFVMATMTACIGGQDNDVSSQETFEGSMAELMSKGDNLKCVYEVEDEGTKISGTVYVAGEKKVRGEFKTTVDAQVVDSYMINDGDWMYTWSTMQSEGIKMNVKDLEEQFGDMEEDEDSSDASLDEWTQDYSYKCSKWKVDNSMFNPPSDVNFVDWTEMMNGFGGMMGDDSADGGFDLQSMCGTCDMLSGTDKEECLINLGCE